MPSWVHLALHPAEGRAIEAALRQRLGLDSPGTAIEDFDLAATLTALDKASAAVSGQTRTMSAQPRRAPTETADPGAPGRQWRITDGPFAGCIGLLLEDGSLRRYERAFQVMEPPVLGDMVVVVKEGVLAPLGAAGTAPLRQLG